MSDGRFRVRVMVCQRLWLFSDSLATIAEVSSFPSQFIDCKNRGQAQNSLAEMLPAYDFFICNAESYNAADYSLWEKEEMRHSAYQDGFLLCQLQISNASKQTFCTILVCCFVWK